jgi:deoxyribodipyrimidine photo-lyase
LEPHLFVEPPDLLGLSAPDALAVKGQDVWLVHLWSLGELPNELPPHTRVIGIFVGEFHRAWPWSERRWRFVSSRMAEISAKQWFGDAAAISTALEGARSVRSIAEPHLTPWLTRWAICDRAAALFPPIDTCCDSFSQWWTRASRSFTSPNQLPDLP